MRTLLVGGSPFPHHQTFNHPNLEEHSREKECLSLPRGDRHQWKLEVSWISLGSFLLLFSMYFYLLYLLFSLLFLFDVYYPHLRLFVNLTRTMLLIWLIYLIWFKSWIQFLDSLIFDLCWLNITLDAS